MGLGHVESIFYMYWKGEKCSREKEEVKAVEQNSISSSESWVIIKSVALLRSNTVDTCLSTSPPFHYTRQSARGPWAASNESEFSRCMPYMIDADCRRRDLGLDCILNELHLWKAAAFQTSIIQHCDFYKDQYTAYFMNWNWAGKCFIYLNAAQFDFRAKRKGYMKSTKDVAKTEPKRHTEKQLKKQKIKLAWKDTKIHECGIWQARDKPPRAAKGALSE